MAYATAADRLIPGVDRYSRLERGVAVSHRLRHALGWLPRHCTIRARITAAQKSPPNRVKPCSGMVMGTGRRTATLTHLASFTATEVAPHRFCVEIAARLAAA